MLNPLVTPGADTGHGVRMCGGGTVMKLNEDAVKSLQVPPPRNRITYFPHAPPQGGRELVSA
jgi:hypothetical protein